MCRQAVTQGIGVFSVHLGHIQRVGLAHHGGERSVAARVAVAGSLDGNDDLLADVRCLLGVSQRGLRHLQLVVLRNATSGAGSGVTAQVVTWASA
jgi:hypothetical protein